MTSIADAALLHQRNVEQLFAASIFVRPLETVKNCGWLSPDSIYTDAIRRYWVAAREGISPEMDDDRAHAAGVAAAMEVGILADVMQWAASLPYMDAPGAYAAEINRRKYLTDISIMAGRLMAAVGARDDIAAAEIIREMAAMHGAKRSTVPKLRDIASRFELAITTGQRSIETFIPNLDAAIGGLERQALSIIAARPSMGKTAIVWQIARNVAASGASVQVYSLEMSCVSLWARAACPAVGVTWRDVRSGAVTPEQRAALVAQGHDLADQYADRMILIDAPQTTDDIWRAAMEHRPDLIAVDHLRLLRDKGDSEVKRLGRITEALKDIAKLADCAVLAAVQLNRGTEARANSRPILSDIRDSGEIEENADLVMMMYRPDYYASDAVPPSAQSATELWIRKFRDGPSNVLVNLIFDPRAEWFHPAERRKL